MNRIAPPLLALALRPLASVICLAAEPDDQAKAIAEIEKLGGKVNLDEKSLGKLLVGCMDLHNTKVMERWPQASIGIVPTPAVEH